MKSKVLSILCLGTTLLQGCATDHLPTTVDLPSVADLPFIYKVDVQQGNVITQDMIAQLQLGMDKRKVNFVMGSPIIMDTFHANRWDYLYTLSERGNRPERRRITLFFENDVLVRVDGDVKAAAGRLVVDTRQDTTVDVPTPEKKGVVGALVDTLPFVGEDETENKKKEKKKKKESSADNSSVEDSAPPAETPVVAKAGPTPIERAALEEQGGPSVLTRLTEALPFTGEDTADAAGKVSPAAEDAGSEREAQDDAPAEDRVAVEEEQGSGDAREMQATATETAVQDEAPAAETPGLLERLGDALTFSGQKVTAPPDAESSAPPPSRRASSAPPPEDERGSAEDDEEAWAWESRYEEDAVISAPPTGSPLPMPLENRLADLPQEEDSDGAADEAEGAHEEEDREADDEEDDEPGFFGRLFGRD